jgi:hypothetical protein
MSCQSIAAATDINGIITGGSPFHNVIVVDEDKLIPE